MQLSYPLKDLKGKVLIDAHRDVLEWAKTTPLTGEYLKKKQKFKENVQLLEDLQSIFLLDPYKNILSGWTENIREWLGELWAPAIMFEELKLQRMRDPYAYRHVLVIAMVGSRLMEFWVKAAPTVKKSFLAFLFHDLGKTRLSPSILDKTESLSEIERQAVYEHPLASFVLNATYWGETNHICAEVGLHHQEDRLGTGYPQKIKTNSLVLDVLNTVDRYDALISDRPFRFQKFSSRDAFDILKKDVDEGRIEGDVLRAMVAFSRKEKPKNMAFKKIKLGTIGRAAQSS